MIWHEMNFSFFHPSKSPEKLFGSPETISLIPSVCDASLWLIVIDFARLIRDGKVSGRSRWKFERADTECVQPEAHTRIFNIGISPRAFANTTQREFWHNQISHQYNKLTSF
jgi:hypothetical protein